MNDKFLECYAERLPYMVEKASIYLRLRGSLVLSSLGSELTIEQFVTLDAIGSSSGICQRDLAKLILKDRSNVTRILSILEQKKLITRKPSTKQNRIVKIISLTQEGQTVINRYSLLMKEDLDKFFSEFDENDISAFRRVLESIVSKISQKNNIQI